MLPSGISGTYGPIFSLTYSKCPFSLSTSSSLPPFPLLLKYFWNNIGGVEKNLLGFYNRKLTIVIKGSKKLSYDYSSWALFSTGAYTLATHKPYLFISWFSAVIYLEELLGKVLPDKGGNTACPFLSLLCSKHCTSNLSWSPNCRGGIPSMH